MIPTFDIEAVGWVNAIAVGFFDGEEYHEFIRESETDDVIWRFLSFLRERYQGCKIYAHCASKFDNKFILSSLCSRDEVVVLEAGLARLKWKDANITFEDSYLLVPMSLKRMNLMFGQEEKGEWEHEKGLKPWEMGRNLRTFRAYLKNDCISLSHSLYGVCEVLGYNFNVTPSISLSTTSAKVFSKCFYDTDKIYPNEEFEEFIRAAIYGGRNEVYKRYGEGINLYDIKSMYVSCYDTPVPIGRMRWIKGDIDKGTLAEATVKVPKDFYIGPLPHRFRKRLIFPVGEFTDWWDTKELKNATTLGVDVSIRRQLYCEEEPILKDFGEFVSRLRKGKLDNFWKMFGVSLSGKLGQSRWKDVVRHISEVKDMEGYFPLDKEELYFQTKEYLSGRSPYIKPAISMRIRAEARIRHLKVISEALKTGDIYYGDTDSIFTSGKLPSGESTGDLMYLGKVERGYFIRQKLYALIQGKRLRQKSAGYSDLKLSEEDFMKLLEGEDIDLLVGVLPPYKSIIKGKDLELLERARKIRGDQSDTRISVGLDTRPICLPLTPHNNCLQKDA